MLEEHGVAYRYRDYKKEPLSKQEIGAVVKLLKTSARDLLRRNDKAYKELGLSGTESEPRLIGLMAEHPTLLQRPIGIKGKSARLGRPIQALLELA